MEEFETTSEQPPIDYTRELNGFLSQELSSKIVPYFEELDERFSRGLIISAHLLNNELASLNLTQEQRRNIQLAMIISDLGKGKNPSSAEQYLIYWLYAFNRVLTQNQKKGLTLKAFFKNTLIEFVGDNKGDTTLLEQGYKEFLESERLTTYCTSHDIGINNISMSQAWSIFHVLMGEEVWDEIENQLIDNSPEKREFQSARKLAELHHAAEGVFIEKVGKLSNEEIKQLGVIILIDKIESYRSRMRSNIIPIHGGDIREELRNQWELDENGQYVVNTDLKHINDLITLFQTSQFPDNAKTIFLSLLWEIYPHLLRRTKVVESIKVANLLGISVERILSMNPQELETIINTDELRVAIRELFRKGTLEEIPHPIITGQRRNDINQKAAA